MPWKVRLNDGLAQAIALPISNDRAKHTGQQEVGDEVDQQQDVVAWHESEEQLAGAHVPTSAAADNDRAERRSLQPVAMPPPR